MPYRLFELEKQHYKEAAHFLKGRKISCQTFAAFKPKSMNPLPGLKPWVSGMRRNNLRFAPGGHSSSGLKPGVFWPIS
jgi:hypothetical protein